MYKKICVAVDGSPSSHEAVKASAQLASILDADLLIMYVIRPMKIPMELQRFIKEDDLLNIRNSALENVAEEILQNAKEIAEGYSLKNIKTSILSGDPASMIVNEARNYYADLIVMGTRGLGKLEGALIGSISRKVSEMTELNMLIVKQPVRIE